MRVLSTLLALNTYTYTRISYTCLCQYTRITANRAQAHRVASKVRIINRWGLVFFSVATKWVQLCVCVCLAVCVCIDLFNRSIGNFCSIRFIWKLFLSFACLPSSFSAFALNFIERFAVSFAASTRVLCIYSCCSLPYYSSQSGLNGFYFEFIADGYNDYFNRKPMPLTLSSRRTFRRLHRTTWTPKTHNKLLLTQFTKKQSHLFIAFT